MNPLVIYHASCADGFGAAFAAWLKFGDEAEYVPMQYGKEDESFWRLEDGQFDSEFQILNREIYILDFSFSKWVMEGLFSLAKCVVWLDHHASVFKDWGIPSSDVADEITLGLVQPNDHHVVLDNNKSGAYLAWEYFHPGVETPLFIKHIDDYDRWQFKIDGTKAFQKALWSKPFDFRAWEIIFLTPGYEDAAYRLCYTVGYAILRAHNQNVQSVVKGGARKCKLCIEGEVCIEDFNGLAANCPPHLTSEVGHELAKQSGTFGLLWFIDKDNRCKCSLRSNGEYDVSTIAKAFGGGGHRNAAGMSVPIDILLSWIK